MIRRKFENDIEPEDSMFWDNYVEEALSDLDPQDIIQEMFAYWYENGDDAAYAYMTGLFDAVLGSARERHYMKYAEDSAEYGEWLYEQQQDR